MYPEFIAIYAGLLVILVLLIVILILQINILRNGGGSRSSSASKHQINTSHKSVVFCKSCATRFSASERVCPNCGTQR